MDFDLVFIVLSCLCLIVGLTTGEDCVGIDYCSCRTSRGVVDLHKLVEDGTNPRFSVNDDAGYKYDFEPCLSLKQKCDNQDGGVAVCQREVGGTGNYIAGLTNTAKFSGVPYDKNNLFLNFTSEVKGVFRTSVFHIVCGDTDQLVSGKEDPNHKATYIFVLKTRYACLSSGGHTDDNNKKISTGSVLLIIFFTLLFLYFVVGILYLKFFAGAQGTEQIPNYEFWSSLPGYIKDGVVFTCRGCKTESSYSQI